MGQRHQIYAVMPYVFSQLSNEKGRFVESNIVALHHQWLYGTLPLRRLTQVFKFYENGSKRENFVFNEKVLDPEFVLQALYAVDIGHGAYHPCDILSNECSLNPSIIKNNDGITIIDFRNKKPKYAFMFLHKRDEDVPVFEPLSAKEYVRVYYNGDKYNENCRNTDNMIENEKEIMNLLSSLAKFEVLTLNEVEKIFPKMFESRATRISS